MKRITNISSQKIINQLLRWGSQIVFVAAIVVMAYLSFVDDVGLNFDARRLTTIALIGIVLNWLVWNTYYKKNYETVIQEDVKNAELGKYCIHRRYYFARKGWKEEKLREAIRDYNKMYVQSWKHDIEDVCARSEEEILKGGYKGYDHKLLIWRLKHHKYPKSGIRGPKDVLYLLSVSSSDSLKFKPREAENYAIRNRLSKFITSMLTVALGASITVEFVQGEWATAVITLLLNVIILFTSLFFGSMHGQHGAKIKLSTVEEACEKLEEWRSMKPADEPYHEEPGQLVEVKEIVENAIVPVDIENPNKNVIELI